MAPLFSLFALFALLSTVIASPHVPRNAYNHAHRAIAHPNIDLNRRDSLPIPKRKRSLNKRCIPRPANYTTSALPTSTAPINVAPIPSLQTSPSSAPDTTPTAPDTTSSPPPPTSAAPSTSYQAPSPTSEPPAPSPTTSDSPAPAPTTSSPPPPAQTSSSSSSSSGDPSFLNGIQTGQGTYYETGLGACGITNSDSDYIVAVSYALFDSYPGYNGVNPNENPVCGRKIKATYNSVDVIVTVTDRCAGCNKITDLDLSPAAFGHLADLSDGRINIYWQWAS